MTRFNVVEAELAVAVFERIQKHLTQAEWADVAIITPYRKQQEQIRKILREKFGPPADAVSVDTVDGFQGQVCAHFTSSSSSSLRALVSDLLLLFTRSITLSVVAAIRSCFLS
jgi:hypothetical protein